MGVVKLIVGVLLPFAFIARCICWF